MNRQVQEGGFSTGRVLLGWLTAGLCGMVLAAGLTASAQQRPSVMVRHRTRLYLKDHSYQIVMNYRIQGDRVLFESAERDGSEEEIPLSLVDLDATHRWEKEHPVKAGSGDDLNTGEQAAKPEIDPELLKEEEERRALTPEVAPNLPLPDQNSVLALDTYQGTPELVPLPQQVSGDLNQVTGHTVVMGAVNPMASPHQILELRGERAGVQLHVSQPVIYVRLGDEPDTSNGDGAFTVDTHGVSSAMPVTPGNSSQSQYMMVRVDVRQGERVLASFDPQRIADGESDPDVIATTAEVLPGNHWMKVTPKESLTFGEYALVEVVSPVKLNLAVWEFGVHPTMPENRDVTRPEPKRPVELERRDQDLER